MLNLPLQQCTIYSYILYIKAKCCHACTTHTFIKITHQTWTNKNITDEVPGIQFMSSSSLFRLEASARFLCCYDCRPIISPVAYKNIEISCPPGKLSSLLTSGIYWIMHKCNVGLCSRLCTGVLIVGLVVVVVVVVAHLYSALRKCL